MTFSSILILLETSFPPKEYLNDLLYRRYMILLHAHFKLALKLHTFRFLHQTCLPCFYSIIHPWFTIIIINIHHIHSRHCLPTSYSMFPARSIPELYCFFFFSLAVRQNVCLAYEIKKSSRHFWLLGWRSIPPRSFCLGYRMSPNF